MLSLTWPPAEDVDEHGEDERDELSTADAAQDGLVSRSKRSGKDSHHEALASDPDLEEAPPAKAQPAARSERRPSTGLQPDQLVDRIQAAGGPRGRYLTSKELNHDTLTRHRADVPRHGWRCALYRASGGLINPGIGDAERARQQLRARVMHPLHEPYRVAVSSTKGGVGKTTVTACIGFAMAEIRGDQVSVIDANPDAGTLADRLTGNTSVTIRHLLRDLGSIDTLTEITSYMSLAGRLKVLASDQDPAVSEALTAKEYEKVTTLLSKYFNLVLTDCGTGISHRTMGPTLRMANTVVVVGSPTVDGASRAGHTLDWLESHGHEDKARNAVVVLNCKDGSTDVDTDRIARYFRTRVRAVVSLPRDPHLAAGGRIEFHRLRLRTKDALTEIAAHIADQFPDRRLD
ncbi:MinD/ParA family protein [Pseudonocardia sp. RS11V-5]|uniref:MinD/ParA family ATP-binding protein n=1 Tax=Pseudonocardia terrae TaxID=2905831 RepID=UPI001E493DBB|nr:MinD/ParA family protein [Pseudonocardia terrae]MCE3555511.1 MinD/ParA family protein [Pseudonocardia terrae]